MDNKIVRILICLLLVCSLLVNVSPIHAEAVVLEGAAAYYALGLAALLILDLVGVVFCLSTPEQIQALGRNWDRFMTDGSSALDYDLEDWEEYKTATIIQFTPNSNPEDDDDFPDGYDPSKIRLKTLEAALNYGICKWIESLITGDNPLIALAVSSQGRTYYNCGDYISSGTELQGTSPNRKYFAGSSGSDNVSKTYDSYYVPNFDGRVYFWRCPTSSGEVGRYWFKYAFLPEDDSFNADSVCVNLYTHNSTTNSWLSNDKNASSVTITYEDGSQEKIYACFFGVGAGWTYYPDQFNELSEHAHIFDSYVTDDEALNYFLTGGIYPDNNEIVEPDVIVGDVSDAVSNGSSVSDMELPDIEYGAIIDDPSDPETAIKENQEQIANGDKTYEDYIEEVAPGESVIIPEPTVTPEPDPSVQPSEDPEVDPTFVPEIDPSESPEVVPDPDPTTSVDPTPDPGTDANPSWLQSLLNGLWELLQRLADLILNGIKSIFVPSEDYVTAKVDSLRENFGFIDSVITTGEYIRDSVSGDSGPPEIYVDLTAADGDTNWGEKVLLTDFSWYAPYKSKVDTVLSAALWAFFGWRVFMRLPGIISGESGYVGDVFSRRDKSGGIKKE